MVTPYKQLPFEISFKDGNNNLLLTGGSIRFYNSIEPLNEPAYTPDIRIKENQSLRILMKSDYDIKLYMDGLDAINAVNVEPFLSPRNIAQQNTVPVKTNDGNNGEAYVDLKNQTFEIYSYANYPLAPDFYVLKLECNGQTYYSGFEVVPLQLDDEALGVLRSEVWADLKDIALALHKRKHILTNKNLADDSILGLFFKMQVIEKDFAKIISALDDLNKSVHSKIIKQYTLSKTAKGGRPDRKTAQLNARKLYAQEAEYISYKQPNYDLPENRYVKKVILELDKLVLTLCRALESSKDDLQASIQQNQRFGVNVALVRWRGAVDVLSAYAQKARKLHFYISRIKENSWFQSIDVSKTDNVSGQYLLDARYRILDQLNKDLRKFDMLKSSAEIYTWNWQRTDVLYELWCFLKLAKALDNLGYKYQGYKLDGGLDVVADDGTIFLSGLKSGDGYVFANDKFKIAMYYDKNIIKYNINTNSRNGTNSKYDNPLYTMSFHDKPDCRMDFYSLGPQEQFYVGSLVIDYKYRNLNTVMNNNAGRNFFNQMLAYGQSCRTEFYGDLDPLVSESTRIPIRKVWAMYPNKDVNGVVQDIANLIYIYSLFPSKNNIYIDLEEDLEGFINSYINLPRKPNGAPI